MLKIMMIKTKKGGECPVLAYEKENYDVYLSFDIRTIARVSGLSFKEIYTLDDTYYIM